MLGTILIIVSGVVSGRRSADVESQPLLGLFPERRIGFGPRHCGDPAVAWADLVTRIVRHLNPACCRCQAVAHRELRWEYDTSGLTTTARCNDAQPAQGRDTHAVDDFCQFS